MGCQWHFYVFPKPERHFSSNLPHFPPELYIIYKIIYLYLVYSYKENRVKNA